MRQLSLSFAFAFGVLVGTSVAQAGSLTDPIAAAPVNRPAPNDFWAGPYVGVTFGTGSADTHHCDSTCGIDTPLSLPIEPEGNVVGIIAGYNWQFNRTVLGFEASIMNSGMEGASLESPTYSCGGVDIECFATIDRSATLQARAGYAFDRALPFVSAGIAWSDFSGGFDDPPFLPSGEVSTRHYVFGVGLDYVISDSLQLRIEGLQFTDPGTLDFSGPDCCSLDENNYKIMRVGLTYSF